MTDSLIDRINTVVLYSNLKNNYQKIDHLGSHAKIELELVGEIEDREQSANIEIILLDLLSRNNLTWYSKPIKSIELIKINNKKDKNYNKFELKIFLKLDVSLPLQPKKFFLLNAKKNNIP